MTNFYKDKQKIIEWLDKYEVKNYTLIPDKKYGFVVDVDDNVDLRNKKLITIPVKFSKVDGYFSCYDNKLTSLEFSPQTVGGNFHCSNNQLKSLEHCPKEINLDFFCNSNKLISLEHCPKIVGGSFSCSDNKLTSLEFFPQSVLGYFYCDNNPKLQEIQKFTDFNLIYLEHKKLLAIINFAKKLENQLLSDNIKKSTKIKI